MSDTCPLLEIAAVLWDACHLFMIFTRLKHITGHTWLDILQALAAMKQYQVEKNLPQVDREGIARTAVAKKSGKVSDECKRSPIGSWPAPQAFQCFIQVASRNITWFQWYGSRIIKPALKLGRNCTKKKTNVWVQGGSQNRF